MLKRKPRDAVALLRPHSLFGKLPERLGAAIWTGSSAMMSEALRTGLQIAGDRDLVLSAV
jgi:hypothetical protein